MPGAVLHPVSKIIQKFLVAQGVGVDGGASPLGTWPVFYDEEPTDPDAVITVVNSSPVRDEATMIDGEVYERQGVMIRLRHSDGDAGYAKTDAVKQLLDSYGCQSSPPTVLVVDSTRYLIRRVMRTTGVTNLGRTVPTSDRLAWTINALVNLRKL
jgi:hypothetical protein